MKNTWVGLALIAALICVNQIWAYDEGSDASIEINNDNKLNDAGYINIDVELDQPQTDNESIRKVSELVRKIAGDTVADEVIIELDALSDEEKAQLSKSIRHRVNFDADQMPEWLGGVAFLAVLLIFGSPILILITVFVFMARKRKQKLKVIEVYLDAGKDVPPELLRTFDNSVSSFKSGIMFSSAGLGVLAAFYAANNGSVAALGLIPLFIGIAKLLYWFFEERKYERL